MSNEFSWADAERITEGRYGRIMAVCPMCSTKRSTPAKRQSKVLAINRIEPEFAVYYCNHCEAQGYVCPEKRGQVINHAERERRQIEAQQHADTDRRRRTQSALELWGQRQPFRGSPAESYLRDTRAIGEWLNTFPGLDQVLGYHPNCPFDGERHPVMLALVRDIKTDAAVAVHRTALRLGDRPERLSRMSLGPTAGGAIKISPAAEVTQGVMIGEGLETVLSASKKFQFRPVWSLIDKGHLARFPVLSGIESVIIVVDNDPNGDGQFAATQCAERLTRGGIEVISTQPKSAKDFNDLLRGVR
jgi:Toprim domain